MAKQFKYSVIIPVYNAENTLSRCVESVLQCGRNDVQLLAVNDGSTDGSWAILEEYTARFANMECLNQKNAGVSVARNTGLAKARGTYITFIDSDDYVKPDYFDVLDAAEDCDLLVFAHESIGGEYQDESALFSKLQGCTTPSQKLELLLISRKIMSPWNKRFKTQIIQDNDLRFIEGLSVGEDFNFCTAYAMHSKTIQVESTPIICNDLSDLSSLSRRYRPNLDDAINIVFNNIQKTISEKSIYNTQRNRFLAIADYLYIRHIFSCISEEFKYNLLSYTKNRQKIVAICESFRRELSTDRINVVHRSLRLALKLRLYYPFYLVSYLGKGRKYVK